MAARVLQCSAKLVSPPVSHASHVVHDRTTYLHLYYFASTAHFQPDRATRDALRGNADEPPCAAACACKRDSLPPRSALQEAALRLHGRRSAAAEAEEEEEEEGMTTSLQTMMMPSQSVCGTSPRMVLRRPPSTSNWTLCLPLETLSTKSETALSF